MDKKECVKNEKTNERIEQELRNVSRAMDSLEDVITEIDNGAMTQLRNKDPESLTRSISELVKEIPKTLGEIADKIGAQADRLRKLLL